MLSFPIDGRDALPDGLPRQLGDAVLCPQVAGDGVARAARARAAAPARLRPRRRDGGARGGATSGEHAAARRRSSTASTTRSRGSSTSSGRTGTCASTSRVAVAVLVAAVVDRRRTVRADRAPALDRVRADRGDDQLGDRGRRSTWRRPPSTRSRSSPRTSPPGAVLIATVNAIAVGYLVFSRAGRRARSQLLDRLRDAPAEVTLIALVLTILVVIATKACTGRGTPLRGGLPSGHAALAFAGWMAATYILGDASTASSSRRSTLIMALLVAQTRVEAGVHSALEVVYGGLLGALIDARRLPGVLVTDDRELYERAVAVAGAGVRAVLELPRRRCRARARRARLRGRERRERRLPARRLRGEVGARRGGHGRLPAGRPRGDRDHRFALRRLPPVAVRVRARPRHLRGARRRGRDHDAGRLLPGHASS